MDLFRFLHKNCHLKDMKQTLLPLRGKGSPKYHLYTAILVINLLNAQILVL